MLGVSVSSSVKASSQVHTTKHISIVCGLVVQLQPQFRGAFATAPIPASAFLFHASSFFSPTSVVWCDHRAHCGRCAQLSDLPLGWMVHHAA